ncbi:glycosyltransferase [Bradyrhizobium sp. MOS002]|uniref:glycosyltransferase n=1 Tax=Bradyrhizobium sp. MOS002 TaxID=2133947 RepID=UPI000D12618F|nr:glycosyltransferase [Bradyrhizobium sp. MOS002]PSO25969.1 colanic acid biosynthesis glycosyltransferase WcaL [Bradyrhizobium sp. MOS002]
MVFKVIHSCPVWLPQTETWLHTQLSSLPRDRVEGHVVCDSTENLDQFPAEHIHSLGGRGSPRYWGNRVVRKLGLRRRSGLLVDVGRKLRADIVHSHFGPTGWSDVRAAKKIGARHVVSFYGYDVGKLPRLEPIWRKRYSEMFAAVDAVLCEGPFMGQSIVALGCPPQKLRIQHLGVPLRASDFRPRRWVPGTPLRVLLAGSFTEKKGLPYALAALSVFRNRLPLEITIVGDAQAGKLSPEKRRILHVIQEGGLGSTVRLLGYQPHARLMEEAFSHHVFLSPSITARDGDSEGGAPVTIIELASTGMPVISTTHCDIPDVLGASSTPLLAPERDVEGIIECLRWLTTNLASWPAMLSEIRAHIEAEYNSIRQGQRLADLYERP